jgi:tetratricopeptide (TPR) repeat protein
MPRIHPVRCVLSLILALAALHGQDSRASRPVAESRTAAESRAAASKTPVGNSGGVEDLAGFLRLAAAKASGDESSLLIEEGLKAREAGQDGKALAAFARLGREHPEWAGFSMMFEVQIHVDNGDLDQAVDSVHDYLQSGAADANFAYSTLAGLEERRGNWAGALAAWEKLVHGPDDPFYWFTGPVATKIKIAKCRFHLGQVDAALELLEGALKADGAFVAGHDDAPLPGMSAAAMYAELAARSGKIGRARKFVAELPRDRRSFCTPCIRVAEAWLAKDSRAIVAIHAAQQLESDELSMAGRFLGELGEPAIHLLAERIEAGDASAIELAGASERAELIAPLEKRAQSAGASAEAQIALAQLRWSVEHPTSRPASRPAK